MIDSTNSYGFIPSDFETFKAAYSQLVHSTASNDFVEVELFSRVRSGVGKKNFNRLLSEVLNYSPAEISTLSRKLAAYAQISDRAIWEAVGFAAINRLMSLPTQIRNEVVSALRSEKNLTVNAFNAIYSRMTNSGCQQTANSGWMQQTISAPMLRDAVTVNVNQIHKIVADSVSRTLMSLTKQPKNRRHGTRNRGRNHEGGRDQQRAKTARSIFPPYASSVS